MKPFEYVRPEGLEHAVQLVGDTGDYIAGGTNQLDLMKLRVHTPERLVDLNAVPLGGISEHEGGLRLGALVTNAATAADPRVRADYPLLARAILAGASPQLRNMATNGGNLCQRTRCTYFQDPRHPCNKRDPGSGCGALGGVNRNHAILGTSDACIATYPGDMAIALAALDAVVQLAGGKDGARSVSARDFHRLPGDTPQFDNVMEPGEIITAIDLPAPVGGAQLYRKVRERSSYAFALVSVAAAVRMEEGRIAHASLACGGVAHKPWHLPAVDAALTGAEPSNELFEECADMMLDGAEGFGGNDFKIPLLRRAVIATLREATDKKDAA